MCDFRRSHFLCSVCVCACLQALQFCCRWRCFWTWWPKRCRPHRTQCRCWVNIISVPTDFQKLYAHCHLARRAHQSRTALTSDPGIPWKKCCHRIFHGGRRNCVDVLCRGDGRVSIRPISWALESYSGQYVTCACISIDFYSSHIVFLALKTYNRCCDDRPQNARLELQHVSFR